MPPLLSESSIPTRSRNSRNDKTWPKSKCVGRVLIFAGSLNVDEPGALTLAAFHVWKNQNEPGAFWFMPPMAQSVRLIPDFWIFRLQIWLPKWQAGKSPSERGRNYTPLREVVHCALPGASCGQQMISVDFQSAPIITGEARLPLRWLCQLPLCGLATRKFLERLLHLAS